MREATAGRARGAKLLLGTSCLFLAARAYCQVPMPASSKLSEEQQHLERLQAAVDQTETEIVASERQLRELKQELQELREQIASKHVSPGSDQGAAVPSPAGTVARTTPLASENAERTSEQAEMQASQIATLDQLKVESASRYPVRITGTLLLNGFVNSGGVDQAVDPTSALGGRGSTGLSLTQTVLGLDASGPHLWGASSRADVRVDFFGESGSQGYNTGNGFLRLRTAHAALNWGKTELFFSLDRTLLNPHAPESLVAVGEPELAWSGNLWSWSPQLGISHTLGTRTRVRFQAALIDPRDPPNAAGLGANPGVTLSEASRYPGTEARLAVLGSSDEHSMQVGVGGYFSPHRVSVTTPSKNSVGFDAWAATLDLKLPLTHGFTLTGSAYRGQSLGGLGGGGYADYVYQATPQETYLRGLEAVGGWAQLHQKVTERASWNVGLGLDNAFSGQVRDYAEAAAVNPYSSIARNRTLFANFIYSPTSFLLFSIEYRNLHTAPTTLPLWISNTTGLAVAYRF